MPHLTLEHTANVSPQVSFETLFLRLHEILANAGIEITNCKSRSLERSSFYIANGQELAAFIHLDLRFLEGISDEAKREIGENALSILKEYFPTPDDIDDLQITVEINDIKRQDYFKSPPNTLKYR